MSSNSTARLQRQTFTVSRSLSEFFSREGLERQTGHTADQWPLVVAKELADNALDACEEADVQPELTFTVVTGDRPSITVTDNGPGIPAKTVAAIPDYSTLTSSRAAYASPTRGAQGNALKTIIAMPLALADGEETTPTIIEARGEKHRIRLLVDAVRQEPRITHERGVPRYRRGDAGGAKTGTSITVPWPLSAGSKLASMRGQFLQIVRGYALLNPHASVTLYWDGELTRDYPALDPDWSKSKWRPSDPTSPHWYDAARFERLVAADAGNRGDRTVRDFVTDFRGLTGSGKVSEVLQASGLARTTLRELFDDKGEPDPSIRRLLPEMQARSNEVKPADLGIIGREHFLTRFMVFGADEETFQYKRVTRLDDGGVPTVIEVAFAYALDEFSKRQLFTGVNWSPAILNPFRQLGSEGESLERVLAGQFVESDDPVIVGVHLASPVIQYLDRGKSGIALAGGLPKYDGPDESGEDAKDHLPEVDAPNDGSLADDLIDAVKAVTKKWKKQKRAEIRDSSALARRREAMTRSRKVSIKDAAYEIMEKAYQRASANDKLPANARQIMYAARNHIQERTGKQLDDNYFTQTLLPDYIAAVKPDWADNVHYDNRGHFREPHTGHEIGLGTGAVRKYLNERIAKPKIEMEFETKVKTAGPASRFGAALFVEKEGFDALFDAVQMQERYDLAFMSSKGLSVTAARELAEEMGIPLFILRDFDKAGFSGAVTFQQSNRRYTYTKEFDVVDLGLRLDDVRALGIEDLSEDAFDRGSDEAKAANLRKNGATEEEVEFLLTKRVELNALTSDQLVAFVEDKLKEIGVRKIVPSKADLVEAFRGFKEGERISKLVEAEKAKANGFAVPADLEKRVRAYLKQNPAEAWDDAVREIATTVSAS